MEFLTLIVISEPFGWSVKKAYASPPLAYTGVVGSRLLYNASESLRCVRSTSEPARNACEAVRSLRALLGEGVGGTVGLLASEPPPELAYTPSIVISNTVNKIYN